MTLALGLQSKQRHEKVQTENVTRESHSQSLECKGVWGNEPTHSQMDSHFGS
jgi:predicted glycoside hydrolase/deacetylase ChbG (UPF0249 family)